MPLLFTDAQYYYFNYKDGRCIKEVAFSLATKSVSFHTQSMHLEHASQLNYCLGAGAFNALLG